MCFGSGFDHLERGVFSLTTVLVVSRRKDVDVAFGSSEREGKIRPQKKKGCD